MIYTFVSLVFLVTLKAVVPAIPFPPPTHDFLRQKCEHRKNITGDRGGSIEPIRGDEDCLYQFLLDSDHQESKDIHSLHDNPPKQKDLNITIEDFHITHIELPKDSSYQFRVFGFMQVGWSDNRLTWDSDLWNIEVMFLHDIHKIWTPSLVDEEFCPDSTTCSASYQDLELMSDGSVVGLMSFQYSAFCSIDYRNYPEDRNDCYMIFSGIHAGFNANFHVSNEGERRKTRPKVVLESINRNHELATLTNEHTPWVVIEEKMEVIKTPVFEAFKMLKLTLRAERRMPTLSVALRFPVTLVTMLMLVSPLFGDLRTQAFVKLLCFGLQTICFIFLCSIAPQNGFGGTKPHLYSYYESVFALTALSIFITIGCMALSRAKRTVPPSHRVYLAAKLVNRAICCIEPENTAHYSRYLEDHENQQVSSESSFGIPPSMAPVIRAKCIICTDQFYDVSDICALPCGHTFHWNCAGRWLKNNKSCPNCRQKVQERNIVKQLFFEECTDDTILENDANNPLLEAKIEKLSSALQKAKNETCDAKDEARQAREDVDSLKDKLTRTEKKLTKLPQIQSENRHLHNLLEDQKALRKELEHKDSLLKASEFFKMFSGSEERANEAMSKYLDANGCPDANKFLGVIKKQLVDSQRKNVQFSNDIHKLEQDNQSIRKGIHQRDNLIKALKEESDQLRANQDMNTPYNRKLKPIFDKAPAPRLSLGFNETLDINVDVFEKAMESVAAPKPLHLSRNVASTSKMDDTIDLFSPPMPKKTASRVSPPVNLPSTSELNDSDVFDSSDMKLPEAMMQRIQRREPVRPSNAMGVVPKSTFIKDGDLCFDRSPAIKPAPMRLAKRKLPERPQLKKTASNGTLGQVTIASFFGNKKPKVRSPLQDVDTNESLIFLD